MLALGGAFFVNGNVCPAAEANVFCDPHAADAVLATPGARLAMVGLDVTHACVLTGAQLAGIALSGPVGAWAERASRFYSAYHHKAYGMDGVYVHDPAALVGVLAPDLFTWREGAVVVATEGALRGATVMDAGLKDWGGPAADAWAARPKVRVAVACDSAAVVALVLARLAAADGASGAEDGVAGLAA